MSKRRPHNCGMCESADDQGDRRPRVFIGSAVEGLDVANALQVLLDRTCEVEVWTQGVFEPGGFALQSLVVAAARFDFAVLIASPLDHTTTRGETRRTPRDNIIFELGLFIGALGPKRTFVVFDREAPPHLPSDLAGVTPITYARHRSGNLSAALGATATTLWGGFTSVRTTEPWRPQRQAAAVADEADIEHEWRRRALRILAEAGESLGAFYTDDVGSMLPTWSWPWSFDACMQPRNGQSPRVLVSADYHPFTYLPHDVDKLHGCLVECRTALPAESILLIRPSEHLPPDTLERIAHYSPAVQWLTIDGRSSPSDLAARLPSIFNKARTS